MQKVLFRPALLVLIAGLAFAHAADADQRDPSLPPLFNDLKTATSADQAGAVEDHIWQIWTASGDPVIDKLMSASDAAAANHDFPAAIQDLDQVTVAKPDFAEGWNKRATVYYLMGNYQQALSDIDRTLMLEPRHFGALAGLGLTNLKLGRDEAAVDAFRRVLSIDPLYPRAKVNLELAKTALQRNSI
jgi:tetratricopeptide (TPR) repeat protein